MKKLVNNIYLKSLVIKEFKNFNMYMHNVHKYKVNQDLLCLLKRMENNCFSRQHPDLT